MDDEPRTEPEVMLNLAVKAVSDTLGLARLIPSALLFEELSVMNNISEAFNYRDTLLSR